MGVISCSTRTVENHCSKALDLTLADLSKQLLLKAHSLVLQQQHLRKHYKCKILLSMMVSPYHHWRMSKESWGQANCVKWVGLTKKGGRKLWMKENSWVRPWNNQKLWVFDQLSWNVQPQGDVSDSSFVM